MSAPSGAEVFFDREAATEQSITFAVPELEGGVSLGVFGPGGELERILAIDAEPEEFIRGLNGLIARWDGMDNAGEALPAGEYPVRGVAVGELRVEGERFFGNDWASEGEKDVPVKVEQILVTPDGLLLAGVTAAGELRLFHNGSEGLEVLPLPPASVDREDALPKPLLGYGPGAEILLVAGSEVLEVRPESGEVVPRPALTEALGTAEGVLISDRLWAGSSGRLFGVDSEGAVLGIPEPEGPVAAWMQLEGALFAAPETGGLLELREEGWQALPAFGDFAFRLLAPAAGGAFWGAVSDPAGAGDLVGEFAPDGSLRRSLDLSGLKVEALATSPDGNQLAVIGREGNRQTTRLFIRKPNESAWEVALERSIDLPEPGTWSEEPVEIVARKNSLDPTADRRFRLRPLVSDQGVFLATEAGLPLLRISGASDSRMAELESLGKDLLRLRVFDGSVVASYRIAGLDQLERIEAGTVTLDAPSP